MTLAPAQAEPEQPLTRGTRWLVRLTLLVLACYWIAIFTGTHLPKVDMPRFRHSDKVAHFSAFFGLSILFSTFWAARSGVARVNYWIVLASLAAYAAIDEVSQIPVGRDCELLDWVADMTGTLLGIGLFALLTWKARRAAGGEKLVVPRRVG